MTMYPFWDSSMVLVFGKIRIKLAIGLVKKSFARNCNEFRRDGFMHYAVTDLAGSQGGFGVESFSVEVAEFIALSWRRRPTPGKPL